jgi:hypothetical protein
MGKVALMYLNLVSAVLTVQLVHLSGTGLPSILITLLSLIMNVASWCMLATVYRHLRRLSGDTTAFRGLVYIIGSIIAGQCLSRWGGKWWLIFDSYFWIIYIFTIVHLVIAALVLKSYRASNEIKKDRPFPSN